MPFSSRAGRSVRLFANRVFPLRAPAGWGPLAGSIGLAIALSFCSAPAGHAQGGLLEELFGLGSSRRSEPPREYFRELSEPHERHHRHGGSLRYEEGSGLIDEPTWRRHTRADDSRRATRHHARRHSFEAGDARAATYGEGETYNADLRPRSICVRSCDGYFFPLANVGHRSDYASHQASCDSLCPEAETKLFVMGQGAENINEAKAAEGGELYAQYVARVAGDKTKTCGCHALIDDGEKSNNALFNDRTLRAGDTVVMAQGVRIFRGGAYPYSIEDFSALAETRVPAGHRGALAAIDRAVRTPLGRSGSEESEPHRWRRGREQRSDL